VSGAIHIAVVADLDSHTYSVKVGGGAVHANIPFDADVPLNQVRFFTDALNEQHFSGQSFDNVVVSSSSAGGNIPPMANAGPDQGGVAVGATVNLDGGLSIDPDGGPSALTYSWTILAKPSGSVASLAGASTATPSFDADKAGIYKVELVISDGTDSDGDTVIITSGAATLLEDDFNRASNPIVGTPSVGGPWVELEETEALVRIKSNKLFFDDTSDKVNRPLVKSSFTQPSTGTLEWGFDFDWRRTGDEDTYRVLMQLGDGPAMNDGSQDAGVGVNLIWTTIGGVHQSLGYRDGGSTTFLEKVSGAKHIAVVADLDSHTYSVKVGGGAVHANIPFDADVPLNQVRFFTDALNEQHFSGQSFDNVVVTTAG
jgi:hypothetical protein